MEIKTAEDCFSLTGRIELCIPWTVSLSQRSAIFNLVVTDIKESVINGTIDAYDDQLELDQLHVLGRTCLPWRWLLLIDQKK